VGVAPFFPVAVIADDNDTLPTVDHGGADSFGMFESPQAGNGDMARRVASATATARSGKKKFRVCGKCRQTIN